MSIITTPCLNRELAKRDLKIADLQTKSEEAVFVSASNVSAGALPTGVTIGASQVTSGTLPTGVNIPANQVTGFCPAVQSCLTTATISASNLTGVIPAANLPSYVDDVLEFTSVANFPAVGEAGKIYTSSATNKVYRWTGTTYVEMSAGSGNALTVPASGVQAGTLPPTVLIDSTLNFGTGAISTDTNSGVSRSATAVETGQGILNNGVHVSPADLVQASSAPAVNGVFSPFQMAIRGQIPYYLFTKQPIASGVDRQEVVVDLNGKLWGSAITYGTINTTTAPTFAPNDSNSDVTPKSATLVRNSNGDTYLWNGVSWATVAVSGGNTSTATRTYRNVTSSRLEQTNYINNTGAELVVTIDVLGGVNVDHHIVVDGVQVSSRYAATSAGFVYYGTVEAIVPAGSTYKYNSMVGSIFVQGQIQKWLELSTILNTP